MCHFWQRWLGSLATTPRFVFAKKNGPSDVSPEFYDHMPHVILFNFIVKRYVDDHVL